MVGLGFFPCLFEGLCIRVCGFLFACFVWLLVFNFDFLIPEAVRLLCGFKVLELIPVFLILVLLIL